MASPVAILTDFGHTDPFVGIMKGVIAGISPGSPLLDLTHEIPIGDIRRGALALWQSVPYFPSGTVFLAVVDPGVGSQRREIIARDPNTGSIFVGPDNGLFTFVLKEPAPAWELANPDLALPGPSPTFHGRDIFAPAAAWAATGKVLSEFGPPVQELTHLPLPELSSPQADVIEGEILHADRFGNLLTSLGKFSMEKSGNAMQLDPWVPGISARRFDPHRLHLYLPGGRSIPMVRTFKDIPEGEFAFLIGSSGLLEIAAYRQSAARLLGLSAGEKVRLVSLRL